MPIFALLTVCLLALTVNVMAQDGCVVAKSGRQDCTQLIEKGSLRGEKLADALISRGLNFFDDNDVNHAIADFTAALAAKPNGHRAYYYRGQAYAKKGELDQALADFNAALAPKAIRTNYFMSDALSARGNVFRARGELDRAIADYTEALLHRPNEIGVLQSRAEAYERKGDTERAQQDRQRANLVILKQGRIGSESR